MTQTGNQSFTRFSPEVQFKITASTYKDRFIIGLMKRNDTIESIKTSDKLSQNGLSSLSIIEYKTAISNNSISPIFANELQFQPENPQTSSHEIRSYIMQPFYPTFTKKRLGIFSVKEKRNTAQWSSVTWSFS